MTDSAPTPVVFRPRRLGSWAVAALAMAMSLVGLLAAARYAVLTPQVRRVIEAKASGLRLGPVGQLEVRGLSGDVLTDLTVRHVAIRDANGVWLDARNVHVRWQWQRLLQRRFEAELVEAEAVRVLRRPVLNPRRKPFKLPISVDIDRAATRLELMPGFSYRRGLYDVDLALHLERKGRSRGAMKAFSRLHAGDHLDATFAIGGAEPMRLTVTAQEALGGAVAGALGLPADRPFKLDIDAAGAIKAGRFRALASSGATQPLRAQGAWTSRGGRAGGVLRLDASTLTAPLAERLGPEVRFGAAAQPAGDGYHALDVRVISPTVVARAWGRGDLVGRRLAPEGVKVDARAPSLAKLVDGPFAGPAAVAGVMQGQVEDWTFTGSASAADLKLPAYGLATVSGPLEVRRAKGVTALAADVSGRGGRGDGLWAALLGGAPAAKLQAEQRPDGQLIVKQLDAVGRGLRVKVAGSRGLLGGVSVRGRAELTNLAAVRPGSGGTAVIEGSVAQARAGATWSVDLDGRGARLALGLGEWDRLVGPSPRVKLDADWLDGRLTVKRANFDGAAAQLALSGVAQPGGQLAFKANWSAAGPFRAGPVELAGKVSGAGDLTGSLTQPRLTLGADIEQIDVPRLPLTSARLDLVFAAQNGGADGRFMLTAASEFGPVEARSAFALSPGGLDLRDLLVDAAGVYAEGSVRLAGNRPSAADLAVTVTPGALLAEGRIAGDFRIVAGDGEPRAELGLQASNVRTPGSSFVVRRAQFKGDGPLADLPYSLSADGGSGQGAWSLVGRGSLGAEDGGYQLGFDGEGALGKRSLRTTETAILRLDGQGRHARLRLADGGGGALSLDGVFRGRRIEVTARTDNINLGLFNPDLDGRVDATLAVEGEGGDLAGTLDATLDGARARGAEAARGLDGALHARLQGDELIFKADAGNTQGLKATADLVLPAEASAAPFRIAIARRRPLSGRISAEGEVGPLWDLFGGGSRSLAGSVRANGVLGGTLADPTAVGRLEVDRGRFDDGATGLSLRDVVLRADLGREILDITEARGVDGKGGSLAGQGRISLARDGASTFRLDLRGFRLIDNETLTATSTGQATITRGADGKVKLGGDLVIDRADVSAASDVPVGVAAMEVIEINRPDSLAARATSRARQGSGWVLDMRLKAPRRVFVRGRGLDVELSLDAHVTGTTAKPMLSGTAKMVRGDYDFAGKRFEFDDRSVIYLSTKLQNIRLQLDATREDPTLTVGVKIRGTAERPEVTLVSTPSLPDDEILARVLFGRSAAQLTAVEGAQLASALSSMAAGGGGLDVIGNLRNFARLDRLAFAGGDEEGVTVSGGKYLTDNIYLEVTGGGREGASAQVEWRIRRNLAVLSRITDQGNNRLAVRWRKDY